MFVPVTAPVDGAGAGETLVVHDAAVQVRPAQGEGEGEIEIVDRLQLPASLRELNGAASG